MYIIAGLHALFMTGMMGYVFSRKSSWDYIYIAIVYGIVFHWTIYQECAISYYTKKSIDPDYIAGSDPINDFKLAFPGHDTLIDAAVLGCFIVVFINLYRVYLRNKIPIFLLVTLLIITCLFNANVYLFMDSYKNPACLLYLDILRYLLIVWALLFIWNRRHAINLSR